MAQIIVLQLEPLMIDDFMVQMFGSFVNWKIIYVYYVMLCYC